MIETVFYLLGSIAFLIYTVEKLFNFILGILELKKVLGK